MTDTSRGEWTSASDALSDRLCRGRFQAQKNLSALPPSEVGDAGTVIHALWTGTDPSRKPTPDENEKAEALREREHQVASEFFGATDGLVRFVEHRLWYEFRARMDDPQGPSLKTSGQFDVALVHPKTRRALICDGKSGWLPVSSNASNLQLRRLATLLWLQIGAREIGVCILKPLGEPEPPCVYTVEDLERSRRELEEDVRESHAAGALRTAGEEQCRYCRARDICPTRLDWLSAGLPVTMTETLPMIPARQWTPEQRVFFLEREKEARDWLQSRKEEIKALLAESPEAVPGYGLKAGRPVETVRDCAEVWKRFAGLGGTVESFMECIKVGKTALKEQLRTLTGHQSKALEWELETLLEDCVESRPSVPIIERLKSGRSLDLARLEGAKEPELYHQTIYEKSTLAGASRA